MNLLQKPQTHDTLGLWGYFHITGSPTRCLGIKGISQRGGSMPHLKELLEATITCLINVNTTITIMVVSLQFLDSLLDKF